MPKTLIICRCHMCTREQSFRGDQYKRLMYDICDAGWRVRPIDRHRTEYTCPKCMEAEHEAQIDND